MAKRKAKSKGPENTLQDISEAEQWRLINETRILDKVEESHASLDTADAIFNAILFIIPFSCLYLMMDILIHQQYGKHPSPREFAGRLLTAVPVLSIFIFYTSHHKHKRLTQVGLFLASIAAGTRLIWLVNRAPWLVVIRQCPPLATVWIYAIAVLNLLPAVIGLALVGVWFWFSDMKLFF
ncbi:hypothetical protein JB92DRAFT_2809684 [Gautieria morchelliformis]|nr:hypothetical protein JB92DRAFT_2809684 [Gautieria morchelliformis]